MRTLSLFFVTVGAGLCLRAATGCGSGDGSTNHFHDASGGGGASSSSGAAGGTSAGGGGAGTGGSGGQGPITTHPDNILVNGGFEYGLSCFGEYVQPDGNADFGFYLSTDAHSGKYAIELRCIGPSCGSQPYSNRAFIVTNPFHWPANQGYALTFWSKCPAGADAFWYTPNSSQAICRTPSRAPARGLRTRSISPRKRPTATGSSTSTTTRRARSSSTTWCSRTRTAPSPRTR
ncbi:MAG TPA: hypothetical protein VHB21_07050 [Minicystis sp.]|nr:hypothetical protein [Minicystis sp.]